MKQSRRLLSAASQPRVVPQPPKKQVEQSLPATSQPKVASQPPRKQSAAVSSCAVQSAFAEQDARVEQQHRVALKNKISQRCRIIKADPFYGKCCTRGPRGGVEAWRHSDAGLKLRNDKLERFKQDARSFVKACVSFNRPSGSSRKAENRSSTAPPKAKGVRFADELVSGLRWIRYSRDERGRRDIRGTSFWKSTAEQLAEFRARPVPFKKYQPDKHSYCPRLKKRANP